MESESSMFRSSETEYRRAKRDMRTTLANAHQLREQGAPSEVQRYLDETAKHHLTEYEYRSRRY